jgi:hypothetical protein
MHATSRATNRECGALQQCRDAGADCVRAATFIRQSNTDRSRKIGASPRFLCDVEDERRIDTLIQIDYAVPAGRGVGGSAVTGARCYGDTNSVATRAPSGQRHGGRVSCNGCRRSRSGLHLSAGDVGARQCRQQDS